MCALTRYLTMAYGLAIAYRRLSFHPMRDSVVHTMWHPVALIPAELSTVSVVPDRRVIGCLKIDVSILNRPMLMKHGHTRQITDSREDAAARSGGGGLGDPAGDV